MVGDAQCFFPSSMFFIRVSLEGIKIAWNPFMDITNWSVNQHDDNPSEHYNNRSFLSAISWPPENTLHSSDAHPVHDVSGQPEGDSLRGGENLPLLKGHTWSVTRREELVVMLAVTHANDVRAFRALKCFLIGKEAIYDCLIN